MVLTVRNRGAYFCTVFFAIHNGSQSTPFWTVPSVSVWFVYCARFETGSQRFRFLIFNVLYLCILVVVFLSSVSAFKSWWSPVYCLNNWAHTCIGQQFYLKHNLDSGFLFFILYVFILSLYFSLSCYLFHCGGGGRILYFPDARTDKTRV